MYTALAAASQTLAEYLRLRLEADPRLGAFFDAGAGGSMVVSLQTPQEMTSADTEGLSVWLYRLVRDDQRLNDPPERMGGNRFRRVPLPVRLHYLVAPIVNQETQASPETEQTILGKVLQSFHDHPKLHGIDLQGDFVGAMVELYIRLEPLDLEEITRVWDALDRSYQLSVSYEVSVVYLESEREPVDLTPVEVVLPGYAVVVDSESV